MINRLVVLTIALILFNTPLLSANSISFFPSQTSLQPQESVQIELWIDFINLGGGELSLAFNPTLFQNPSFEFNPLITPQLDFYETNGSQLEFANFFIGLPSEPILLGKFTLEAITSGLDFISLENSLFFDLDGWEINTFTLHTSELEVKTAPVPEPASFYLLGSGLCFLIHRRRKKF